METVGIPKETMEEVRQLRQAMEGRGFFITADERDAFIDRTKEKVADIVLTILVNRDRAKQERFLLHDPE